MAAAEHDGSSTPATDELVAGPHCAESAPSESEDVAAVEKPDNVAAHTVAQWQTAELGLADATAIVEAARSAADFTRQYDTAVDAIEDSLLEHAMDALRQLQPGSALAYLQQAEALRERYVELLDEASSDHEHLLHDRLDELRAYALGIGTARDSLGKVATAFELVQKGESQRALEVLNEHPARVLVLDSTTMLPTLAAVVTATGENFAGVIRESVRDFAGARAAYDRASVILQQLRDGLPLEMNQPFAPQLAVCEAGSLRMQSLQLLQVDDYKRAGEVSETAARKMAIASELLIEIDPASEFYLVPIVLAQSHEQLAVAEQARAEDALERFRWEEAVNHSQRAGMEYETASMMYLQSKLPAARLLQERALNSGFFSGLQFRRRIKREQDARTRYEQLERELQQLYGSVRSALAPIGVTVNNQTELVNTVQQQVDIVNQLAIGLRKTLETLPEALEDVDLSVEEKKSLIDEAAKVAGEAETPKFFDRLKTFAAKLTAAASRAGATATPILDVLKALSVLP